MVEDIGEYKEEDCADEIDRRNSNIETVDLLVHIRPQNAHSDKEGSLNQNQCNGLSSSAPLSEANKHTLNENVNQEWNNEIVSRSLKLNVEETPLVQRNWIRIENICWVLMHGDGALGDANYFGRSPSKDANHSDYCENSQNDFGGGISNRQLPETKNNHLRETNQDLIIIVSTSSRVAYWTTYNAEKNALQHSHPAIAEVSEFVTLHLASFDETLANNLEKTNA